MAEDKESREQEDRDVHEEEFGDDDMKTLDDLDPAGAQADGRDSSSHETDRVGEDG